MSEHDNKVIKQVKEDNTMNKGNLLIKEANEHLDSKDYFAFKEVASNMLNASNIKESKVTLFMTIYLNSYLFGARF